MNAEKPVKGWREEGLIRKRNGWRRKSGKKRLEFEVLAGGSLNFSISP